MLILFCDNSLNLFLNFRGPVVKYFHDLGYRTAVIVPEHSDDEKLRNKAPEYLDIHHVDMNPAGMNPISDISYFTTLFFLFRRLRPDIVFLYTIKPNIYGSFAAQLLDIPAVAMVAGLGYVFGGNTWKHKFGRRLYKWGLSKASNVIVLNSSNYNTLCDSFVKRDKLILFQEGEGVDLTEYPFTEDSFDTVKFLMVARVLYDKGYSEYVEAIRLVHEKYPDIKTELLGPIDYISPMGVPEHVVKSHHEEGVITYLGVTDNVPQYIGAKGVVVVLPSYYHEGLNRSLMEACSMGRPVITTDIAGCREVVRDGVNGHVVKPKDSRKLADKMISIIEMSPEQRRIMGNKSFEHAKKMFDINKVLVRYQQLADKLIKK